MKTLILYKTKWGSTKEYADYIGSQTSNSEMFSIEEFDANKFDQYEKIIIGSRVYMGKIQGLEFLVANWEKIKNKKVFLFAVGLISPESKSSIEAFNSIPEDIRKNIGFIKLPGKVDTKKLNLFDKLLYKMVNSQKNNPEFKPFNQEFSVTLAKPVIDFANA